MINQHWFRLWLGAVCDIQLKSIGWEIPMKIITAATTQTKTSRLYLWTKHYNSGKHPLNTTLNHYGDAIMSAKASQITSISTVCSAVCSCTHQRKHQGSASLTCDRWPMDSPHKGPVTRKIFLLDDVIMMTIFVNYSTAIIFNRSL